MIRLTRPGGPLAKLKFDATMKITGVNPYVLVSAVRARAIKPGWRKPLPVLVRVNGAPKAAPWRINLMPTGEGSFYLYLHGDLRRASKTGVGDRVRIELEFDAKYRGGPPPLPPWFSKALKADPRALAGWGKELPSHQKDIVRYLMSLKTPAARVRVVERVLKMLVRR